MPITRCSTRPSGRLPDEAVAAFHRDGVLIVEGFKSRDECEALRTRANELVLEHGPKAAGTIFSTKRPQHQDSQYFLDSACGIGVFFEEEAFDAQGKLAYPLPLAVNKLGHAMHDLDPVFSEFSKGSALQAISESLGVADPRVMQSMYIFKQPGIGGEVVCHQDSTYLYTEPMSVIGYWFAIDDAHTGNGCLGGLPGEHRKGMKNLFRRQADGQTRYRNGRRRHRLGHAAPRMARSTSRHPDRVQRLFPASVQRESLSAGAACVYLACGRWRVCVSGG